MKAAVYFNPEDIHCTDIDSPKISQAHEVLVKVIGTSICGSDLHLYSGAMDPIMEKGQSQTGHELIGEVVETGNNVGNFKTGDRISMAYSCSCGECYMCEVGQTAHCETTQKAVYGFGVPFGNMNGTHAEFLTLPYADAHAIKVPDSIPDQAALTLSCNLPSAIIANNLADIQPGENVALIGCGPTGLMSLEIALQKAEGNVVAIDKLAYRLKVAEEKGAKVINSSEEGWHELAMQHCQGRGFDKVIEVVGYPETLQMALDLIRPGGTIAAIGVFCGQEFNLVLADVFLRDISLHMNGFANVQPYMWESLRLMERGVINPASLFTHEYKLDDVDKAFKTFYEKSDNVLKVMLRA